jgi:DNA-binding transcriptional LysR family regulator
MLDPRRLLTFREVAGRRSFSRAAEALALTQPAVSQQVGALERQLGVELLERKPGGLALTEAGELLLEHANAVSDRLHQADAQLSEFVASADARLRVGAFPSALASVVPDAIGALRASDPELLIEVREAFMADLAARVLAGDLHVAVCFEDAGAEPRAHPGLKRHELGREPMDATVGPDHRLARRRSIRLDAMAEDTWAAPSPDQLVYRACVAAGFEPRIAYITRDPLAIRGLVAAGLAVTLVPRLLAGQLSGIRTVRLSGDVPHRRLYALTPETGTRPAALAFVEAVAKAVAARVRPAAAGPAAPSRATSGARGGRSRAA